jgi:hypothetical protein
MPKEEEIDDLDQMINAGQFMVTVMNKQDHEKRKELLLENIGAMLMLTNTDMNEKKAIVQQIIMELDEIDKKNKSVV